MLHNVYLHGHLGLKYGHLHKFDIINASQAARALCANFKEFYNDFKDGHYQVIIGSRDKGFQIDEKTMGVLLGKNKDVHIIPVIAGSGGGRGRGVVKTITGIALTVGSFFVAPFNPGAASYLFNVGVALTFFGVATLLTPAPDINDYEERETPDRRASFLFNGAKNKGAEGSAIPIVYGRMRVGSVIVSGGIQTEQVEAG